MRFVLVNHRYAPFIGGSERYIQEIAEHLVASGHYSKVVTSDAYDLEYFWDRSKAAVDAPGYEQFNGVDIRRAQVDHIPANSFAFRGLRRLMGEASTIVSATLPYQLASSNFPRLPTLSATLEDAMPADIVHACNLGLEGLAVVAERVARDWQSLFVLTPFIHLGRTDDSSARRYVSMPHQVALLKSADLILTMTELEREFIASLGIDCEKIFVVGAGINFDEITGGNGTTFRTRYGIEGPLVASIGALAEEKGTMNLVRAVQRLRKRGYELTLVLAGPPLSRFNAWFQRLDAVDRDGIIVTGVINKTEKRDLLAAMDLLAMPSRTESFGIVYLEAWANRKPVIAANAGAVHELVIDDTNGLLVEFGCDSSLENAIERLVLDASLRARLGAAGNVLARERYTWKDVIARVMAAHSEILGYQVG